MSFAVTGTTEDIYELLFGPAQHDEHCKGWRWELYMQDSKRRMAAVDEATRQIIARVRREEEFQQAAE